MTTEQRFKIALIKKGLTASEVANNLGVTTVYLSQIVKRMDKGATHLLPKSGKSLLIQDLVKEYLTESEKELA